VIRSFRSADAQELYQYLIVSKRLRAIAKQALRKIQQLDSAGSLVDLALPGSRLEKLTKDRIGQHSIRINDQWRICFRWQSGDAYEVEIVDYH
jgi:proteic killer suppression protein